MKAISVWQPWATLLAIGAKQFETRAWASWYTGPIAIHAAKTDAGRGVSRLQSRIAAALFGAGYHDFDDLPRGGIIAVGELVEVVEAAKLRPVLAEREVEFGDYRDGRFGWKFDKVRPVKKIELRGAQGIFPVPGVIAAKLIEALCL